MMRRVFLPILALMMLVWLSWAMISLPPAPQGLTRPSLDQLRQSGVSNPVTAELLNYRGYDTLLEVAVLLLAIMGVWSLGGAYLDLPDLNERPLLFSLLRILLPILTVVSGYLLWIGAFAPGGAFQGGALLGGALVLVVLGGMAARLLRYHRLLRAGLALGLAVFIAAAGGAMTLTGGLLRYPPGAAGAWILAIESAALLSIALTLGALYLGGRPLVRAESDSGEEGHTHE